MPPFAGRASKTLPPPPPTGPAQGGAAQASAAQPQTVGVAAALTDTACKNAKKLDRRHSIVDPMKLLGLDRGLQGRKQLAQEHGCGGDAGDSAVMSIWLHKQGMQKLAENGGKLPDEMRS